MNLSYIVTTNQYATIKEVLKVEFHCSDRLIIKLKKEHKISLNGNVASVYEKLTEGDYIEVNMDFDEESDNIVATKMRLSILYEDDFILIVNKPAHLAVHPSVLHYSDSLCNGVKYYFKQKNEKIKVRPVNRLDKDTSGIVVFAKHAYIQECLIQEMQKDIFTKEYKALVNGHFEPSTGTITAPITRKENSIIERKIDLNSTLDREQAVTHYKTLKTFKNASLVKFKLETGRTHQIRVHCAYKNCSIIGDTLYGEASTLIDRQALHAYKISFIHPIFLNEISIQAPLPKDFRDCYKILKNEQ